jgi:CO/xanthine dehydrogenase FAD-binding subunit
LEAARQLLNGANPQSHNAFKVKLAQNAIVRALQTVV